MDSLCRKILKSSLRDVQVERPVGIKEKQRSKKSSFRQSKPNHTSTQLDFKPLYSAIRKVSDALHDGRSIETIIQLNENLFQEVNKVQLDGSSGHVELAKTIKLLNDTVSNLQNITKSKQSKLKKKNKLAKRLNKQTVCSHPVEKSSKVSSSKYRAKPLVVDAPCKPHSSVKETSECDEESDPPKDMCTTKVQVRDLNNISNIPFDIKDIYQEILYGPAFSTYRDILSPLLFEGGLDIINPVEEPMEEPVEETVEDSVEESVEESMRVNPCDTTTSVDVCWTNVKSEQNLDHFSTNLISNSHNVHEQEPTTKRKQSRNKRRESKKEKPTIFSLIETVFWNLFHGSGLMKAYLSITRRLLDILLPKEPTAPHKTQHQGHSHPQRFAIATSHENNHTGRSHKCVKHSKHLVSNIVPETEDSSVDTQRDYRFDYGQHKKKRARKKHRHASSYNQDETFNNNCGDTAKPGISNVVSSYVKASKQNYVKWEDEECMSELSTINSVMSDTDNSSYIPSMNTRKISSQRFPWDFNDFNHHNSDCDHHNDSFHDFIIDSDESECLTSSSVISSNPRVFFRHYNTYR